jgi:hypothetical protein
VHEASDRSGAAVHRRAPYHPGGLPPPAARPYRAFESATCNLRGAVGCGLGPIAACGWSTLFPTEGLRAGPVSDARAGITARTCWCRSTCAATQTTFSRGSASTSATRMRSASSTSERPRETQREDTDTPSHTHTQTHTHTHTHTRTHIQSHTHTITQSHNHTITHTYTITHARTVTHLTPTHGHTPDPQGSRVVTPRACARRFNYRVKKFKESKQ